MNKNDLFLVKNDNDEFLATTSKAKAIEFSGATDRLNCYSIDCLSTSVDSNIDCYYGKYSVICHNRKTFTTTQL